MAVVTSLFPYSLGALRGFAIRKSVRPSVIAARFMSSQQQPEIRSTIPNLGHGVSVGQYAEVVRKFTESDIELFGSCIHDKNILHSLSTNWESANANMPHMEVLKNSGIIRFQEEDDNEFKPLVHGIFVASMFSSIFATLSPGCVYMNQSINFVGPVYAGDRVLARVEIQRLRKWRKGGLVLECSTMAHRREDDRTNKQEEAITGVANVWLPSAFQ